MEVCKVAATHPPRYPDKQAVVTDASLLLNTPERWLRNTAVCTALASGVGTAAVILLNHGEQQRFRRSSGALL